MKKNKERTLTSMIVVIICIFGGIGIADIIINKSSMCPTDYEYKEYYDECVKILQTNARVTKDIYGRETITCPYGYTPNRNGVTGIDVPHIDVPHINLPGVTPKCYKNVTTEPKWHINIQ